MEEIKVGEYVRINNDMRAICIGIGKVIRIVQETIYVDMRNDLPISFQKSQVAKHSFNIIDLIEVGDYVNGSRVNDIDVDFKFVSTEFCSDYDKIISDYEIKTILTKEMYTANCYEVE